MERVFERMKRYSEEFRDESVRLVLESERSVAEIARELGISVWTLRGWLYLAGVLYLCHREVVGWSKGDRLSRELVMDALRMAQGRWRPGPGLLLHSDRPVCERGLPGAAGVLRDAIKHEPEGRLLGQCTDGEFLRDSEEGADPSTAPGPMRKPGARYSSTSRCSTTGSGYTRAWGMCPQRNMNGSLPSKRRLSVSTKTGEVHLDAAWAKAIVGVHATRVCLLS